MTHSKKLTQLFSDFLALNLALAITYFWFFESLSFFSTQEFQMTTLFVNLLWFATLFFSNRIYTQFEYTSLEVEVKNFSPNYVLFIVLFYVLSISFFPKPDFSYSLYYGLFLSLMLLGRIFIKYAISYKTLSYITIGHCESFTNIKKALSEAHRGETNFLGCFSDSIIKDKKYLGPVDKIGDFLKTNKVNLILYVSNAMTPAMLCQLMHYAKHNFIEFKIIPLELDYLTEGAKVELHHGVFLSAKDEYVSHSRTRILKRAFDIVFSSLVIIFILSWLFPLLCLLIMLESKGSPIFFQDRVGFRGKIFRCIKFRSLKVKENGEDVKQVQQNDSRITKVGAFIRKSNLDEMPQFFNVLMGTMSIVGPRPHPVSLDLDFKNTTEDYILRHYTKPGITGWAQVNGWRGPTDTYIKIFKRTQCDLWYLKNRSFGLDLKIVFLTVFSSKVRQNAF
jgi:putative colanic acid biosysnthesis UDP-glucose lipid carrier transferase